MARLNPRRRLLAKIAVYDDLARRSQSVASQAFEGKLQQGPVGCALARNTANYTLTPPRDLSLEGRGKAPRRAPKHLTVDGYTARVVDKLLS